MKLWGSGLAFGGDWNPDQWPEEVWRADLELMRDLGVNLVSVPVFAWPQLEVADGVYETGWLADILDAVDDSGIRAALATATATPPAWLVRAHPEMLPTTADGVRLDFGSRQSYCPSSAVYRERTRRLVRVMAERFADHPALALWHVNNEYGDHVGRCWCDSCAVSFRRWLVDRHGSLDAINHAWGTKVWGQVYTDLDQIKPPRTTMAPANPAHLLDFERFGSDSLLALLADEVAVLREVTPGVPVTTNFMGLNRTTDYWAFARQVDLVTDDAYPDPADPHSAADIALSYGLMRSLKQAPWLLLESAPGAVSWREVNLPKAPGQQRADALQAVGHGSEGAMFFQWRAATTGPERFHSAILGHRGTASRSYREATGLARDLAALAGVRGSQVRSSVAMLVDWDAVWSLRPDASLPRNDVDWYTPTRAWHRALHRLGLAVDCVPANVTTDAYRRYAMIVAPAAYLVSEQTARALTDYVHAGGTLVVGPFSGVVDLTERVHPGGPPGPLREVLGVEVDEHWPIVGEPLDVIFAGWRGEASRWAEWVVPTTAQVRGHYADGTLFQRPAVTLNAFGDGRAAYLSCDLDANTLAIVLRELANAAGVTTRSTPIDVEVVTRTDGVDDHTFVVNHHAAPVTVHVPAGAVAVVGPSPVGRTLTLPGFGAAVVRTPAQDPTLNHVQIIEV